jgi:fatty acid desaturase
MDEAFAPAGAIDKRQLKSLAERSDARGLARLASHVLALMASAALVTAAAGTLWLLPAMLVHGILLVFLFAPLHEAVHYTAFRSRRLNQAVAWVCGALLMLPPEYFRAFHFGHHRDTQDPARDPELIQPKPRTLREYLLVLSGLPHWRERTLTTLRQAARRIEEPFIPRRRHSAVMREARLLLGIYGAVAVLSVLVESTAALTHWVGPVVLAQPALRGFLLAEHTGCPLIPEMLENSRTTKTNAVVRWLTWNMSYHAEHHAYPALPFHALPKAHGLLAERIAVQAPGYLSVHLGLVQDLLAARRLSGQAGA